MLGSMLVIRETTVTVNSFPNWKLPLHECKKYFLNSKSHEGRKT